MFALDRGGQRVLVVELLRGVALNQDIAMVERLEVSLDDISTVSSIHMTLRLWVTIKESLSHDSENGGNTTAR